MLLEIVYPEGAVIFSASCLRSSGVYHFLFGGYVRLHKNIKLWVAVILESGLQEKEIRNRLKIKGVDTVI
jgi:hypothetical protein